MVGVAGKSKACHTCRARRIRCDLRRPSCYKCLNSGRTCPGYRKEPIFVHYGSTSSAGDPSLHPTTPAFQDGTTDEKYAETARVRSSRDGHPEPQVMTGISNQHVFRDLFAGEFLRIYLPDSQNCPRTPVFWPQLVLSAPIETLALQRAMSAVTFSVLGSTTKNRTLAIEGSKKYGQALGSVQQALYDGKLMYKDETLAACCALNFYEVLEVTNDNLGGWRSHVQGLSRLIEARGPDSYDSPLANMLYNCFRHNSIIQDIEYQEASRFTHPKWQNSPFRRHNKGPNQKLYDIGAELSIIVANAASSKSIQDDENFASRRIALLEECQSLDENMEDWLEQMDKETPSPRYWPEYSNIRNPVDDLEERKIFPVSFRFSNIFIARIMLDYWAFSIILQSTTLQLYLSLVGHERRQSDPEHPADSSHREMNTQPVDRRDIPPPKVAQDPGMIRAFADNIAQSMEYCLSDDMGILGSQWAVFPLRSALQTYRYFPDSKGLPWLQATHDRISDEKGVRFSKAIAAGTWVDRRSG